MIKTKNYKFCTVTFFHDNKRQLLCIDMIRKGKVFYQTTLKGVTKTFVTKFIKGFNDEQAKEINSLEMENL